MIGWGCPSIPALVWELVKLSWAWILLGIISIAGLVWFLL